MEEWKKINHYPYEVSSLGKIRNFNTKQIKISHYRNGYPSMALWSNIEQKYKTFCVHHLVAQYFLGNKPSEMEINHKDGNKINCNVNNLEYLTRKENMRHSWMMGLHKPQYGPRPGYRKLDETKVAEIKKLLQEGIRPLEIAANFGVTDRTIRDIKTGRTWAWDEKSKREEMAETVTSIDRPVECIVR